MAGNSSFICPTPLVSLSEYSGSFDTTVIYAHDNCVLPCPTMTFSGHDWNYMNRCLTICACVTTPICALVLFSHARDFSRFYVRIMFIAGFFVYAFVLCIFNVVNNPNNDVVCASSSRFIMRGSLCIFQALSIVWCFIWINTWSAILAVDTFLHVNLTLKMDSHDYMKSYYTSIGFLIPTIVTAIPLAANNVGFDPRGYMPICFYILSENSNYFRYSFLPVYSCLLLITLGFTCACAWRVHTVLITSNHYKSYFAQRKPASRMIELGSSSESIDASGGDNKAGSSVFNIHYSSNVIDDKSPYSGDFIPRLSDQFAVNKSKALGPGPKHPQAHAHAHASLNSSVPLFHRAAVASETSVSENIVTSEYDDFESMNSDFMRQYIDPLGGGSRNVSVDASHGHGHGTGMVNNPLTFSRSYRIHSNDGNTRTECISEIVNSEQRMSDCCSVNDADADVQSVESGFASTHSVASHHISNSSYRGNASGNDSTHSSRSTHSSHSTYSSRPSHQSSSASHSHTVQEPTNSYLSDTANRQPYESSTQSSSQPTTSVRYNIEQAGVMEDSNGNLITLAIPTSLSNISTVDNNTTNGRLSSPDFMLESSVSRVDLLVRAANAASISDPQTPTTTSSLTPFAQWIDSLTCGLFIDCLATSTTTSSANTNRQMSSLRETFMRSSQSMSINPVAHMENIHVLNIMRAVWLFNGRSMMMVIAYGVNNLIGIPMLIVILASQFDSFLNSQYAFVNCLVSASLHATTQTQEAVNEYASTLCGSHQNNLPSYTLVRFVLCCSSR